MQKERLKLLSIIIVGAVILTVVIQGYWNYRNFQVQQQHFKNDVQQALDLGLEVYYTNRAQLELFDFGDESFEFEQHDSIDGHRSLSLSINQNAFIISDSIELQRDTLHVALSDTLTNEEDTIIRIKKGNFLFNQTLRSDDSLSFDDMTAKIVVALRSLVDTVALRTHVNEQLERKGINIDYELTYAPESPDQSTRAQDERWLKAEASMALGTNLQMYYENSTMEVLRRGLTGLAISVLTALVIMAVLLYLYRTIKQQKELAEIKNDLISNLTHEFKTPIATVATALEGIDRFNHQNDPQKTKKYLDISTQQLKRLDHMVEKLLETATLEQDQLSLKLEQTNISQLLEALCAKYALLDDDHIIEQDLQEQVLAKVDVFHFENALSNLLDNAIKYGGQYIKVQLRQSQDQISISVQDNGGGIKRGQQAKVFDKFYRIPTGNQHDVKGYGIGLYYSRKIVEKHGGELHLKSKPQLTEFTMVL